MTRKPPMPPSESITRSLLFLLSKTGQLATERFAVGLTKLALRPRLVGALALTSDAPMLQHEIAAELGVAPSVVVDMVDEREAIGAVTRERSLEDRRQQKVSATGEGKKRLRHALALAADLEAEMLSPLNARERETLRALLVKLRSAQAR
jgi:DNA-binding MarR family transcriptional regulator